VTAPLPAIERDPEPATEEGGEWQIGGAVGGWWATERAKLIRERVVPLVKSDDLVIDLGCGRGEAVDLLVDAGAGFVIGVDFAVYPQWRLRSGRVAHVVCDARHLPFRPGVAALVTSFDVIEHFTDDSEPLRAAREIVRDEGHVAVTVPASPALWSPFDDAVGHHRRYTRESLERVVQDAELTPQTTTYFFSWLVAPMWALRKRDRSDSDAPASSAVGRAAARAVTWVCRLERAVLRRRNLPFGTSLFTICRPAARQR
jgi:SAM-dependent methyltransferase